MVEPAVMGLVETEIRDIGYSLGNVLITGGTGTFGHAFARALLDRGVRRVAIYSRGEQRQAQMKAEFNDPRLRFYIGDVRDEPNLECALQGVDTVVHAAALKRLDSDAIDEFTKTNIMGSMNVIEACHRAGVTRCVGLSSDKACSSSTPYGSTKEMMTWLFIAGNGRGPCQFSLVRYGNIVNSNGSVYGMWEKLYKQGKPLPITDHKMSRFWMPIEDAVGIVFKALERMRGGEVFIPSCVEHSKISEQALSWFPGAELVCTGKRAYEKYVEEMISKEEVDRTHDCGDCYVLTPFSWNWAPPPYGLDVPLVPDSFTYNSDTGDDAYRASRD